MLKKTVLLCMFLCVVIFSPYIPLASGNIWDVDNNNRLNLRDILYGLQLLSGMHEMPEKKQVVLINLGDSLTNGAQSGVTNVHEATQRNGFAELLADQFNQVADTTWTNPYITLTETGGIRKNPNVIPYNLSVTMATVKDVLTQKTNADNPLFTELLKPIPDQKGDDVTQLEAALYVASLHPDKEKIFTVWIGSNDVLWAVIDEFGTKITQDNINAVLNDTEAGHDLNSIKNNLLEIVNTLKAVENSHIFIGTLPYISEPSFFFSKNDIKHLAQFSDVSIPNLPEGSSLGFGPFIQLAGSGVLSKLATNEYLENAINEMIATDGNILSPNEKQIVDQRIDDINAYIKSLASPGQVTVVDTFEIFQAMYKDELTVDDHQLKRIFGGGLFSLDAFHPGNTGHAFIANTFIEAINQALQLNIPLVNISEVFHLDPYQDKDNDGFIMGPPADFIDPSIVALGLTDCDDSDPNVIAPFVSGTPCRQKK